MLPAGLVNGTGTLNGRQNKVFASRLVDADSVGRTLLGVRIREILKIKVRVVLRAVSLAFIHRIETTC